MCNTANTVVVQTEGGNKNERIDLEALYIIPGHHTTLHTWSLGV